MTKQHHVFLIYRADMVFDDRVTVHAKYTGHNGDEMLAYSTRQLNVFPDTAPRDKMRPQDELLNRTVLTSVSEFVIKYCEPGDLFVTLVHNLNHEYHHPLDREELLELSRVFDCDIADIVLVEVVLGKRLQTCQENAQSLLSWLGE